MAKKLTKMAAMLDFWQFFGHKMPKIQNFQNRPVRSVEHHTRKVHSKFQVPSMYGVQMNGTEVPILKHRENDVLSCFFIIFCI